MSSPLDRQDQAVHLGVLVGDSLIQFVPRGDLHGERTRQNIAARLGVTLDRTVVLTICNDHPLVAAVDCLHPGDD